MAVVTLDSNNVDAILADAGVVVDAPAAGGKSDDKAAEVKPDKAATAGAEQQDDPDDIEGDDGLTPAEKRDLTAKMQKAIGKRTARLRDAEEFAADQYNQRKLADARAERAERELNEMRSKSTPVLETKAPEKPVRANYSSEEEYVDAMIQFGVDQRLKEKAEEDAKARAEREREERVATVKGRIDHAIELVPDFTKVMEENDAMIPPAIAGYMEKSELIAELAYHLAKNPDVLVSLAKLPPDVQLVKIGRIESTLTPFGSDASKSTPDDAKSSDKSNGQAKPAPSADTDISLSKPRGNAAPVITPLDGTGSAGISKDSKDMNIRETIDDWSKRNKINLGQRKRH